MDNFVLPIDNILGKVETVETKLTWHIKDISENLDLSEINSPIFTTKIGNSRIKWMLVLSPSNNVEEESENAEDNEKYLDLQMICLNANVQASVNICILNVIHEEVKSEFVSNKYFKLGVDWYIKNYIELKYLSDKKSGYTSNDRLTIVCTITINESGEGEIQKAMARLRNLRKSLAFTRLGLLFNEQKFSDFVFVVGGEEIHVHKCILANRSSVFKAMFSHDMSELRNNRVEISDISYVAMLDLLKYIYTEIMPEYNKDSSEKSYMELLIAAEKYCLDYLKNECEEQLSKFVQVDNIFEYLNFSDTHNAHDLKETVMEFIVDHGEEIIALPSFKERCSELNADVVSEVFRALVIKKRKIE